MIGRVEDKVSSTRACLWNMEKPEFRIPNLGSMTLGIGLDIFIDVIQRVYFRLFIAIITYHLLKDIQIDIQ